MIACTKMAVVKKEVLCFALLFSVLQYICDGSSPADISRSLKTDFICDQKYPLCRTESENASFPNLIHVSAAGPNDTLHYLISTIGVPTLLVARTPTNASVKIKQDHLMTGDYSQLGDDTITFSDVHYVYSVLFTMVYEYNDVNDTADLTKVDPDPAYWSYHNLSGLQWLPSVNISDDTQHVICLNVSSEQVFGKADPFYFQENGSFSLKFQFKSTNDRDDDLPRLEFNANNTQVAMVLDNVDPQFNNSRFALGLALVSDDDVERKMDLTKTRSIDDEHTPGVFEMVDWTTRLDPSTQLQSTGAYVQWKPVCYKAISRSLSDATKQFYYDLEELNSTDLEQAGARVSLAYAYFGSKLLDGNLSMSVTNVSFGLTKDKFYQDTNYTIWTFSIGYGIPPSDQVSLMIMLVISIGLGLPVLLILFGGIFVCCKKRNAETEVDMTSSYSAIN